MIKVALVTTWEPERCGLAQYASDLIRHVNDPVIKFNVVSRPFDKSIIDRVVDCDIVHVNHVWGLYNAFGADHVHQLRAMGKKTLCSYQESSNDNRNPFTLAFDRVVVHKDLIGFTYIPHGLWDIEPSQLVLPHTFIGTAGFPFGFKNYPLVAKVAQHFGLRALFFAAESHHVDAHSAMQEVHNICPTSMIITEYKPPQEVITRLSRCLFTMFPQSYGNNGVSGSVRFGISAKRPVVISQVPNFYDLRNYTAELYVIPSNSPTLGNTIPVVEQLLSDLKQGSARVPKRLIADMNWNVIAQKYVGIYKELMSS